MNKRLSITLLLLLFVSFQLSAQESKGGFSLKNLFKKKQPEQVYLEPDSANIEFEEDFVDGSDAFTSENQGGMVSEDDTLSVTAHSTTLKSGLDYVEVMEGIKVDCVWFQMHDYYCKWDCWSVDPYDIDALKFKDTVDIALYNVHEKQFWSMPLEDHYITSPFGMRRFRWHYGTDLRLTIGDTVRVAFDGVVRISKYDKYGYGWYVMVRHKNGLETLYGHLKEKGIEVGTEVKAGDFVGYGGNTGRSSGPHLHFEVRYLGDQIDPTDLYDFDKDSLKCQEFKVTPQTFSYLEEARKPIVHRVRRGETLSHISRRYGVSMRTICRLNGISTRSILRIGQRLRIR